MRMTFSTPVTPTLESDRCTVGVAAWTSGARTVAMASKVATTPWRAGTPVLSLRSDIAQGTLKLRARDVETAPRGNDESKCPDESGSARADACTTGRERQ